MRTILTLALLLAFYSFAQTTSIPDPNFEQFLIDLGEDSGTPDGTVLTANISDVTELYIQNKNITDLTGIEDFAALQILRCDDNMLTSLDLSQNIQLTWLLCSFGQLKQLMHKNPRTADSVDVS